MRNKSKMAEKAKDVKKKSKETKEDSKVIVNEEDKHRCYHRKKSTKKAIRKNDNYLSEKRHMNNPIKKNQLENCHYFKYW